MEDSFLGSAVRAALAAHDRIVLAVSGGIDSMVLLDAAMRGRPAGRATRPVVATFDHGTGPAATAACVLVQDRATALHVECAVGRAHGPLVGEAALRSARWAFLRRIAKEYDATIVTAHTRDDQVETVLMRVMRGAGARGLAGLYAETDIERPLLQFTRAHIACWAQEHQLAWVEDPSNASREYFRNRVRHELLPALRAVDSGLDDALLAVANDAARWRRDVDARCNRIGGLRVSDGQLSVPVESFAGDVEEAARILWPALAARAGVVLDRRGIERLATFTRRARVGARVQLSGGWEVTRVRGAFVLARMTTGILPTALRASPKSV